MNPWWKFTFTFLLLQDLRSFARELLTRKEIFKMKDVSLDAFGQFLNKFLVDNKIPVLKAAKVIGCPEATMKRILGGETKPTDAMMKQGCVMIELGVKRYSKLSKAEKEKISAIIGTTGGGVLGFGAVTAAVSAAGITGLSAAGITSGLAAIGSFVVGGGMVAGLIVTAGIPIVAAGAGYGIVKGIKFLINRAKLNKVVLDSAWETGEKMETT